MPSLHSIKNYIQLTDRIATAGQPGPEDFRNISQAGYSHIINLGMPDHPHAVADEAEIVANLGMNYHTIPVPFDSPQPSHVLAFCELMHSLKSSAVFVHCIMNFRASAFLFLYLKHIEGLPEHMARSVMFDHWTPDATWQDLLEWDNTVIGWIGE